MQKHITGQTLIHLRHFSNAFDKARDKKRSDGLALGQQAGRLLENPNRIPLFVFKEATGRAGLPQPNMFPEALLSQATPSQWYASICGMLVVTDLVAVA